MSAPDQWFNFKFGQIVLKLMLLKVKERMPQIGFIIDKSTNNVDEVSVPIVENVEIFLLINKKKKHKKQKKHVMSPNYMK